MLRNAHRISLALALGLAGTAGADVRMPGEFDNPGESLNPLFSYFGGVNGFGVSASSQTIYSGGSLELWANFQPDAFFNIAGFAVGSFGISGAALDVPAGADTFSVTVEAPAEGQLSFTFAFREDDNNDGAYDPGDDDQWESDPVMLMPGVNVYNVPLADFLDANPGNGNDAINVQTTGRLGFFITFESRESYPGGIIETPVAFNIDHLGFYTGDQSLPDAGCPADWTGDTVVDSADFFAFISDFLGGGADFDGSGTTDSADFFAFIESFLAPCG